MIYWLFDTTGFPARWVCGPGWSETPWLGWLHIVSDIGVWSAYLAIPLVLIYFITRRRDLPFRKIFLLFGGFILACGTTHLMEAIIFWWPAYRLAGVIKLFTAIISWATVFALIRVVPGVLSLRNPIELEREIAARERAEQQLHQSNAKLEQRVEQRTSDLRLMADALLEERELLQTTLRSIGDAVAVTDIHGQVTFLNGIAEELTGWETGDAIGKPLEDVFQIIHEMTRQPVQNPATEALELGKIVTLANHTLLVSRQGNETPIEDSAAPIRSENGEVRGAVLVFRDVTERKQTLRTLREQEERLRLAVNATALGIFDYSFVTGKQSWSQRCREIWGIPANVEIILDDVFQRIHPDDRQRTRQAAEAALDLSGPGQFVVELRLKTEGIDDRWIQVRGTTIFEGTDSDRRAVRSLGTMLDITERKNSEHALRESEAREKEKAVELESVLRATPAPIWISHDGECRSVTGNPASYRLLGVEEGSNVSATASAASSRTFQELRDGRPYPAEELPLQRAAREGIEIRGAEISIVREDGDIRHLYGNATPILQPDGSTRGAVAAFMDITAIKISEQALKDADRRKDEFLAILAHELRNPLAPIRNSLEIMKRSAGNEQINQQSVMTMERQLAQMVRLVDDLIDVSRITRNKLELKRERIELASILLHISESVRPLLDAARHQFVQRIPETPIYLYADSVRLSQVFGNLLGNACKYTAQGGMIEMIVELDDSEVVVKLKDNGIGIPANMLMNIFEMFTQIDRSMERAQNGLGIGLTLVKRLVELHDGSVIATSPGLGQGSEFIVRLPVLEHQPPAAISPSTGATPEPTKTSLRVLVVDDNYDSAISLGMLLKLAGHHVETAHDGQQAIEFAAKSPPDLILLDLGLPKANGFEVCQAIRQQPLGKLIKIVALTGWGQEDDRRKSREAGFDQHLVKPINHDELMSVLNSVTRTA